MLFEGTQIISPWLYYMITRLFSLDNILIAVGILSLVTVAIMGIACLMEMATYERFDSSKNYVDWFRSKVKKYITLALIPLMISFVIPSKDDVAIMMALQALTYENVEGAVEIGKDVQEYMQEQLLEIIKEVKDTGEE